MFLSTQMATLNIFLDFTWGETIAVFAALLILYGFGLTVFRVYLHPLSQYPGPKLAAATLWYEFYYDVVRRGRFAWEIKRMHEIYGPVVRINPFELHIDDPDFYDELYAGSSRKRDRLQWSANMFLLPDAMISTVEHDLHRKRRAPMAVYFSSQAIRRFDPFIRSKLEIMHKKFEEYQKSGKVLNLNHAFTALTTDIITQYAYGVSHGFLEADDFNPEWFLLLKSSSEQSLLAKQMPWLVSGSRKIPLAWLRKIKPEFAQLMQFEKGIEQSLQGVMSHQIEPSTDDKHSTIFHGILQSGLPASEITHARLVGEAQTVVAAGTLTTAHYLKVACYHLLANPNILAQLTEEINIAMPDPAVMPSYAELNRLPFLNAVIDEGFRLSHGVIARLTRVAPDEDLTVAGYTISAGTPIGMSSWLIHLNPLLFPSPDEFLPQRWLEPGAERLKKYLVNFTKGSRICLGKDLARTEIVYTLVSVIRKWVGVSGTGMQLYKTSRRDVDIEHDFFNPYPALDSLGVRVLLN